MKTLAKHVLLAVTILAVLVFAVSWWLTDYTRQGDSVTIPNVISMKPEVAQAHLEIHDLLWQIVDSSYNKSFKLGTVIKTIPPTGSTVKKGRTIYIWLNSSSAGMISIPNVWDVSQRQATAMLKTLGVGQIEIKPVPGMHRGLVVGVEYKGFALHIKDKVPVNATVTLLVSTGVPTDEEEMPADELFEDFDNPFEF